MVNVAVRLASIVSGMDRVISFGSMVLGLLGGVFGSEVAAVLHVAWKPALFPVVFTEVPAEAV